MRGSYAYTEDGLQYIDVSCHGQNLFLGILSILLKCSLSDRFDITLGEKYNNILKKWILDNRLPSHARSLININLHGTLGHSQNLQHFMLDQPQLLKYSGLWVYFFYFFGLTAYVAIGDKQDRWNPLPEISKADSKIKLLLASFDITPAGLQLKQLLDSIHGNDRQKSSASSIWYPDACKMIGCRIFLIVICCSGIATMSGVLRGDLPGPLEAALPVTERVCLKLVSAAVFGLRQLARTTTIDMLTPKFGWTGFLLISGCLGHGWPLWSEGHHGIDGCCFKKEFVVRLYNYWLSEGGALRDRISE